MNVAELFFKSCTYQPLAKWCFFPFYRAQKKILPLQTSLKQFQLQQSWKNFVSHLIINLQTSAKFLENWIVIFFKESKMLFFTFRLTIAISNHFSKNYQNFEISYVKQLPKLKYIAQLAINSFSKVLGFPALSVVTNGH